MWTDSCSGVALLTSDELEVIEGGRSLWYYVAYVVGEAVGIVTTPGDTVDGGWSAWHG